MKIFIYMPLREIILPVNAEYIEPEYKDYYEPEYEYNKLFSIECSALSLNKGLITQEIGKGESLAIAHRDACKKITKRLKDKHNITLNIHIVEGVYNIENNTDVNVNVLRGIAFYNLDENIDDFPIINDISRNTIQYDEETENYMFVLKGYIFKDDIKKFFLIRALSNGNSIDIAVEKICHNIFDYIFLKYDIVIKAITAIDCDYINNTEKDSGFFIGDFMENDPVYNELFPN